MAFYRSDPAMKSHLEKVLHRFTAEGRPGLTDSIAITWIRYETQIPVPGSGLGTGFSDLRPLYPASVVKLFYAVAIEAWLKKDLILDNEELRRAMQEMIAQSSNDATSLIVDLLTGTTSGPSIKSLKPERWESWVKQRNLINNWLNSLNWPELEAVNCCQKTWNDGPFGREKDFYGAGNKNRNLLTTAGTARMLEGIMTNNMISAQASKRLKTILSRSIDLSQRKSDPENQVDGFLGEGLPIGSRLWSKAGWMSQARHDAAWWSPPHGKPMMLVVFCQGRERAKDSFLLPALAHELNKLH
ncbi:serine hydrolase [Prochlorococcus sp. MIT 1300]|uniref:serine hydrolase n=1 Tax=Prochlorococcus sp. MIT 1300 TaxID=3096218 RepID=UPI002A75BD4C|nr:serine hydrolase [Prochlorococcus sp. MIT 1300]